jgi:hypothetical protein
MLMVKLRRMAWLPLPVIGRTQWSELKVLTKMTHWLGPNSKVFRVSTSSKGICLFNQL